MSKQKKRMNNRSQLIGLLFLLFFFAITYRFYVLQVVDASFYQERSSAMYSQEATIKAQRGTIFDRNGETLAKEATSYSAVAIITENEKIKDKVQDPLETAKALSPILDMSVSDLQQLLSQKDRYQVELRPGGRKINREKMEEISKLKLPGIIFTEEPKRYYTNNDFASHVIGFISNDGEPVMGLESSYNDLLQGQEGHIQFKKDGRGNRLPQGISGIIQPVNGNNIYLTLDERIQLFVEQALNEVEAEYSPEKMTVIVSRPKTGEILAMSSRPSFNPNQYSSITNYVNHAVSSSFEPGSTFKIVTLAAAIEEGIYDGEDTYMSGRYTKVPGGIINDYNRKGWGEISFLEGVQKSSNVAFTILGWEKMPRDVFFHYINRFGFGSVTGVELPNERKGFVKPQHGTPEIDVANMTFGQGVSVTAIQQITAMNAIANGGKLLQPYIIDKIENPETGEILQQNKPKVVYDQVVSKKTSKQVADILESVVTEGTGANFYLEEYSIAGKTGTAQKVGSDGRYVSGQYIHSFIGFAPKEDPELLVYVLVDSPKIENYILGGSVVAKIFKPVMQNSLQYLSVTPDIEESSVAQEDIGGKNLADYKDTSIMTARQKAEAEGLRVFVLGDGTSVVDQVPTPGSMVYDDDQLYLITGPITETVLPDLTDWSLREVRDWANMAKLDVVSIGKGYVVKQSKNAGYTIKNGESIIVHFEPKYEKAEEIDDPNMNSSEEIENPSEPNDALDTEG
jgi:penicillin-binding protein 2B